MVSVAEPKKWKAIVSTALAAAIIGFGGGAMADLNKFEADVRGEFGIGSAAQFGSADLKLVAQFSFLFLNLKNKIKFGVFLLLLLISLLLF